MCVGLVMIPLRTKIDFLAIVIVASWAGRLWQDVISYYDCINVEYKLK